MIHLRFDRCRHEAIWPDDWWERIDRYTNNGRLLKYWRDNAGRPGIVAESRACPLCPGVKGLWQHSHRIEPRPQ